MNQKVKNIHWFPGHMKKAINKIEESLKMVDFVIEVLDSRAPLSTQNEYVEKVIKQKPTLYVLTKKDLSIEEEANKWISYFEKEGKKAIAINLKDQASLNAIFKKIVEFCKEKDEKYAKKGIKNISTRAMIIGIPNVGKSTLINYLAKKSVTKVENKPGLTKNVRWVKIDKLEVMDTPGILEPQLEDKTKAMNLALIGGIKQEILPKEELLEASLNYLLTNHKEEFFKRYDIEENTQKHSEILAQIAKRRGFLLKDGEFDLLKAQDILLNEFRNGIICKYTLERVN